MIDRLGTWRSLHERKTPSLYHYSSLESVLWDGVFNGIGISYSNIERPALLYLPGYILHVIIYISHRIGYRI